MLVNKGVILISGNDYVKFVTEKMVTFINSTPEQRQAKKQKQEPEPNLYSNRWFGVLPFAFKIFRKKTQ